MLGLACPSKTKMLVWEGRERGDPHLFERLFVISWENNRDCHITMPLSLKTMEVQVKGDQ